MASTSCPNSAKLLVLGAARVLGKAGSEPVLGVREPLVQVAPGLWDQRENLASDSARGSRRSHRF